MPSMKHFVLSLLPYALLASGASINLRQEESERARGCCQTLQSKLRGKVSFPRSPIYEQEQSTYYSSIVGEQGPACRVGPTSAQDVSKIVTILTQGKCKFAVRSGGHMAWFGANNIDAPGVTIDMGGLDAVTVLPDESIVQLGPGLHWGPVYDALAPYDLTIVGGRSNTVGVGGYLLGGGIAHNNAQHGLAAQNIVNYEIVLANGTIANVNAESNPDLHVALQTGSTNYGIVTRFDLITYQRVPIWGGARSYDLSQSRAFLEATLSFMDGQVDDPLAGGVIISMTNTSLAATMAYYNGDGPLSDAFDEINAIPTIDGGDFVSGNQTQQELSALVDDVYPGGRRVIFNVLTFKADVDFALDMNTKSHELFEPFLNENVTWAVTFQPFGKAVTEAVAQRPNFQDIETGTNLLIFGIAAYYDDPALDGPLDQWSLDIIEWGTEEAEARGLDTPWIYLNYALPNQDVYRSFGEENHQKLRSIRDQVDPKHVFEKLWPGGFKL